MVSLFWVHKYVSCGLEQTFKKIFEFSLNIVTEIALFSYKKKCVTSCVTKTEMFPQSQQNTGYTEGLLTHASMIYQIPWIHWIFLPFRENSSSRVPSILCLHEIVGIFQVWGNNSKQPKQNLFWMISA